MLYLVKRYLRCLVDLVDQVNGAEVDQSIIDVYFIKYKVKISF